MSARRPLVGVSFKMYFDMAKTTDYVEKAIKEMEGVEGIDIFVIPDFVTLMSVQRLIKDAGSKLLLGAQDVHSEDGGAFTGEVSPKVLAQAGVRFVEIGHAERRRYFRETDADVVAKAKGVARNSMVPLVCIGERERGTIESAIEECMQQIGPVLEAVDTEVVVAYEPVWAIGKSEPASGEYVVAVTQGLRARMGRDDVRILYGGSAGPGLFARVRAGVDGLFLGRFAHDVSAFHGVVTEMQ